MALAACLMLGGAGASAQTVSEADWTNPDSAVYGQLRTIAGSDGVASAQDLSSWALPLGVPQNELDGAIVAWTNAGLGNTADGFNVQDVIAWIVTKSGQEVSGSKFDNLRSVAGDDGRITEQEFLQAYFPPQAQGGPTDEQLASFMTQLRDSGAGSQAEGYDINKLVAFVLAQDALSRLPYGLGVSSYSIAEVVGALPAGLSPSVVQTFIDGLLRTSDGRIATQGLDQAIRDFIAQGNTGLGYSEQFGGYLEIANNWTPPSNTDGAGGTGSGDTGNTGGTGSSGSENPTPPTPELTCTQGANGEVCRGASDGRLSWRPTAGGSLVNSDAITTTEIGRDGIAIAGDNTATLTNTGKIETRGNFSAGIRAGGVVAPVTIENHGAITTSGEQSSGIAVNSGRVDWVWDPETGYQVGNIDKIWPGSGVTVRNYADISTTGLFSSAIFVTSGMNALMPDGSTLQVAGGTVVVHNEGRLSTATDRSMALFAGSQGGDVSVTNLGAIVTAGLNADGIHASSQSAGGVTVVNSGRIAIGGVDADAIKAYTQGTGNVLVDNRGAIDLLARGGSGLAVYAEGSGTASGTATAKNSGVIVAKDAEATGISVYASEGAATVDHSGSIRMEGARSMGISASSDLAGVNVITAGDVIATAADSYGIFALAGAPEGGKVSIEVKGRTVQGGSGITPYQFLAASGGSVDNFGGSAGIFASGSEIAITNAGRITALNGMAIAIGEGQVTGTDWDEEAQANVTKAILLPVSKTTLTNTGEIAGAVRLGSGGNVITNSGAITGDVDLGAGKNEVKNSGAIAGKISGGDGGNSLVNSVSGFLKGLVSFGSGADSVDNAGRIESEVALGDGANKVDNRAGAVLAGPLKAGLGDDVVSNAGTISGDVDLGSGANKLDNLAGGVISSGRVTVGSGNTFANAGDLSPGGRGVIAKTVVIGNFVQTASGRMVVDINEAAATKADSIEVTGRATLAGLVVPNVIDLNQVIKSEYRVLTASGGAVNNGLAVGTNLSSVSTVGYNFGVEFRGSNDVFLTASRPNTLSDIASLASSSTGTTGPATQNFVQLGTSLNQAEQRGGGGLTPLINAVRLQSDGGSAAQVMNRLIPQNQGSQTSSTTTSGTTFGNAMLSCSEREGEYAYVREGKCYYAKLTARRMEREASNASAGSEETGFEAIGGVQVALYDQVRLGLALGYEETETKTFDRNQALGESSGNRMHAGVVLKDQWGPINAYLNLGGSIARYDHERFVNLAGVGAKALSDQEVMSGIARLRFSYLGDMGAWYWKPLIDVGTSYIHAGGYTETGAGAANLRVSTVDKWLFSVMPGLEVGGQIRDVRDTIYRPYIRGGITLFNDDTFQTAASFDAAGAGVAPFVVTSNLDTVFADVEAGVHVLMRSGVNLRFSYEGRFSENTTQNAATLKASVPY